MKWLWFTVLCFINYPYLFGQCPTSAFLLPQTACLNEQLIVENNSSNSTAYELYLCDVDYSAIPAKEKIVSTFGAVFNSRFVHDGSSLYLFFVSQTQNKLVGLRFSDQDGWDFEVHADIDLSGIITNPVGIEIINDNGRWTGLLTNNVSPFKLVRIVFGSGLRTIAEHDDLSALASLSAPFDIEVIKSGADYVGFVTNSSGPVDKQLIRLAFGASMSNRPAVTYIGLPAGSEAASVEVYRACDAWTVFISSRNGKLLRVRLGPDPLTTNATVTDLTLSAPLNDPGGMGLVEDHDELIFILQSRNGNTYAGKIASVADNTVDITNLGNIKTTSRDWGIETFRVNGSYKIVSASFASGSLGGLYALEFFEKCPANQQLATGPFEPIYFREPGSFKISMKSLNAEGQFHVATREITVADKNAPQITITRPEVYCLQSSVPFEVTSDLVLTSQIWDFGDGAGVSSASSTNYVYSQPGTFDVIVNVTASNGCNNLSQSTISIYDPPISAFTVPSTILCTNNEFLFNTTTPDHYNGNLSYQWYIDDNPVSTDRNLRYTFITTGSKEVKLTTSIPGCSDEITQTTSFVQTGLAVDFSYAGACEDDTFYFHNETSEQAESFHWQFGAGQTSFDPDPAHNFDDFGSYVVTLTATNAAGCENVKTKTITVHSRPVVDFAAEGPPNACAGSETFFENQTTNPDNEAIERWQWNFMDASTPGTAEDGIHIFSTEGNYNVALRATTQSGCSGFVEKMITINPSPSMEFTFTPACVDNSVIFSSSQDLPIAFSYWEIGTSYYYSDSPTHTFHSAGDYPVYAQFYGANGCISESSQTVHVPQPLSPQFSVLRNCVDQEAIFTDLTAGDNDRVVSTEWIFDDGQSASNSPATHMFRAAGMQTVTLQVTGVSGCSYRASKKIQVITGPVAAFTTFPSEGAYPLDVSFTNSSSGATVFYWEFMDGTGATSDEQSPDHIFSERGTYRVTLTASNPQQCEDSFSQTITTSAPLPDADIDLLNLVPNADGSTRLIVTIINNGNTLLKSLPLTIDLGANATLKAVVSAPIFPGAKHNFVLSTPVVNINSLQYLCVSLDLQGDVNVSGNRMCEEFKEQLFTFPAYPNPAVDVLSVEWISEKTGSVTMSILETTGKRVFSRITDTVEGLNTQRISLMGLRDGLYFLIIDDGSTRSVQRIAVQTAP